MSNLWLLKLIHDADEFTVDDIGSVEGLDVLFSLWELGYIEEDAKTKVWSINELGLYRLSIEDASASELEKLGTELQIAKVEEMKAMKWRISHLWEYEDDVYAAWMIADNFAKAGNYVHSMVLPDGSVRRFENTLKERLK